MKFRVNDEVWCPLYGSGVVYKISDCEEIYKVHVNFSTRLATFTEDGKLHSADVSPCLYHKGVHIVECEPKRTPALPKFKPYQRVLIRGCEYDDWCCSFFSHYTDDTIEPYMCSDGTAWHMCIPYKGNEHFVGTGNDVNENEEDEDEE